MKFIFTFARLSLVATIGTVLCACANFPTLQAPSVSVDTVRMLSSSTLSPEFEVVLNVDNPNPIPLKISSIAYDLRVEGQSIVDGITSNISPIESYGDGQVVITATPDLLTGARVIAELVRSNRESLNYALAAELDIGRFLPAIRLSETGEVRFNP